MPLQFEVKYDDENGDEVIRQLPAKYEVCPRCEGHGAHLNEAIASHAFTTEEFERDFDEEQQREYLRRGGIYDVPCTLCEGKRVVVAVDRKACLSPEHLQTLALLDKQAKADAFFQSLVAAELRFGC